MKTLYFLEQMVPTLDLHESQIVSLDPAVSYQLNKKNVPYKILEDFYQEKELFEGEDVFFFEQMKWFDAIDAFLQKHIRLCRTYHLPLTRTNYTRFKYCIDSVLINDFILQRFFKSASGMGAGKIFYVPRPGEEKGAFSIFKMIAKDRWIFGEHLRLYAEKYAMAFAKQEDFGPEIIAPARPSLRRGPSAMKSMLKNAVNIFKFHKFFRSPRTNPRNLFFLHAGGLDVDIPIDEFIRHGATVFVKEHGRIIAESSCFRREQPLVAVEESVRKQIFEECSHTANVIHQDPAILSWLRARCGIDPSTIVLPFLAHFIGQEIPAILCDALQMGGFFREHRVSHVLVRANSDLESQGPLIAAKYMKHAHSVCLQHASVVTEGGVDGVADTVTYDTTFARDPVSERILKDTSVGCNPGNCRILCSAHYFRHIQRQWKRPLKRGSPETIVYVEKKFPDRLRFFNNIIYPITWYYEFQKKLVDFFAEQKRFSFVYKHADTVTQPWTKGSILKYVSEKQGNPIKIYSKTFMSALRFADRVIMDSPSGALFEAAVAGKPVLCLYADHLRIAPVAKELFGRSLQSFHTSDEALAILKRFLDSDPEEYKVKFPLDRRSFYECFTAAFDAGTAAKRSSI